MARLLYEDTYVWTLARYTRSQPAELQKAHSGKQCRLLRRMAEDDPRAHCVMIVFPDDGFITIASESELTLVRSKRYHKR